MGFLGVVLSKKGVIFEKSWKIHKVYQSLMCIDHTSSTDPRYNAWKNGIFWMPFLYSAYSPIRVFATFRVAKLK